MFTYQSGGETLSAFIQQQSRRFDSGRSFLRYLVLEVHTLYRSAGMGLALLKMLDLDRLMSLIWV